MKFYLLCLSGAVPQVFLTSLPPVAAQIPVSAVQLHPVPQNWTSLSPYIVITQTLLVLILLCLCLLFRWWSVSRVAAATWQSCRSSVWTSTNQKTTDCHIPRAYLFSGRHHKPSTCFYFWFFSFLGFGLLSQCTKLCVYLSLFFTIV